MLRLNSVNKAFGNKSVINDLSYSFEAGEVYGLMGANGSGKTTLFNLITGNLKLDTGEILFEGKTIANKNYSTDPATIANLGVARTFQDIRIFPSLTVEQHLKIAASAPFFDISLFPQKWNFRRKENAFDIKKILETTGLTEIRHSMAGNISYGQQKLLVLGLAVAKNARFLLLDEPVAGVQPIFLERIIGLIEYLNKNLEMTIIFVEHNPFFIRQASDNILFLNQGRIIVDGHFDFIRQDPRVKEAYF